MNGVSWVEERQAIDTVGVPQSHALARVQGPRQVGVGAGVSVATSGWIPALIVLGVIGLAIYGGVKAVPPARAAVRRRRARRHRR